MTTPFLEGALFAVGSSSDGFLPVDGVTLPAGPFVAKFASEGVLQWMTSIELTPMAAAARVDGSVVVGGHGQLPCGGYGVKAVAVDSDGAILWSWAGRDAGLVWGEFGDSFLDYSAINRVEVDPLGNVYAVGRLMNESSAALDFGDGAPKTGRTFIASLDASGQHRWSHGFDHGGGNFANGAGPAGPLARTPNGQLVWATQVDEQGMLRTFAPDGTILWARPIHTNELIPRCPCTPSKPCRVETYCSVGSPTPSRNSKGGRPSTG